MKKTNIILILLILIIPTTILNAKEKTIGELENELAAKQRALEANSQNKAKTQNDIKETQAKINNTYSQLEKINKDIEEKENESKELEEKIKIKNKEIKSLMRYYEVTSSGSQMLEYIMGAESLTDLIYRLSITEQITNYNKKVIKEMNDMIEENEKIKADLNKKKEEIKQLQAELNNQVAILNEKKASLDEEGHSITESIEEMKKTVNDWKKKGCKTNETPTSCMNRLYPKSSGGGGGYLPSGSTFYRPTTSGRISSNYGWRTLYGSPNLHAAIDISTPVGTSVYAVATGRVAKVIYSSSGGGNQIIVHHNINGQYYTSYYAHLSSFVASVGQTVTKDTVIAKSGNTGNSTGPHLHLGLARGRWYLDYYSYYGDSGFVGHSFDPRNVIVFPAKGGSYSNR